VPQAAGLQLAVQSGPKHPGTAAHRPYPPAPGRVPADRTADNTRAPDGSANRSCQPPLRLAQSPRLRSTRWNGTHWPSQSLMLGRQLCWANLEMIMNQLDSHFLSNIIFPFSAK